MSVVMPGTPIYEITFKQYESAEEETVVATGEKQRKDMIRLMKRADQIVVEEKLLWIYGKGVPV